MSHKSLIETEGDIPCQCDNCSWEGMSDEVVEVADLTERVAAGEIMPAGECPECGALAHYEDSAAPKLSQQGVLHSLRAELAQLKGQIERMGSHG